jgi:hypothetical protein
MVARQGYKVPVLSRSVEIAAQVKSFPEHSSLARV